MPNLKHTQMVKFHRLLCTFFDSNKSIQAPYIQSSIFCIQLFFRPSLIEMRRAVLMIMLCTSYNIYILFLVKSQALFFKKFYNIEGGELDAKISNSERYRKKFGSQYLANQRVSKFKVEKSIETKESRR